MVIQIGAKPDSGFDDPLGMLKDCHRRIESFLGILRIVAERTKARRLNDEQAAAVSAALQYFRTGGRRHTADEEVSLFPRICVSSLTLPSQLRSLEDDHREAEALHQSVESLYTQWITAGGLDGDAYQRLSSEIERLSQLYGAHIRVEEDIVFPYAALTLDSSSLAVIGSEFERRRKVHETD